MKKVEELPLEVEVINDDIEDAEFKDSPKK